MTVTRLRVNSRKTFLERLGNAVFGSPGVHRKTSLKRLSLAESQGSRTNFATWESTEILQIVRGDYS